MFSLILTLTTILSALWLKKIMNIEDHEVKDEVTNGGVCGIWSFILDQYGFPFGQFCISTLYGIYIHFTFINMIVFFLKYVPTVVYMYKCLKNMYLMSRERLKQKQMELEDIQLQIQIVNTKLCVYDSELSERAEQRRRSVQRLMRVRSRVRDVIAGDDSLRRMLHASTDTDTVWDSDHEHEDCDAIVELLKELKDEQVAKSEGQGDKMDCGEHVLTQPNSSETSVYTSLSDGDVRQDCRLKIVKVTNVYKVAYLKHYIKQKRQRRANKHALLKKKADNIKKLLEEWQKTLNLVINSKLAILNIDPHPLNVASQEAMGDYSKPRDSSDSDNDFRNSCNDMCLDEYTVSWAQDPDRTYPFGNYEEIPDTTIAREFYDSQDLSDSKYPACICQCKGPNRLSLLEELSESGIEEVIRANVETAECRDLVAL